MSVRCLTAFAFFFSKMSKQTNPLTQMRLLVKRCNHCEESLRATGLLLHELADGLPLIQGHKNQLQQVIVNLVHNSIEAMATLTERSRVLLVKTDRHDSNAVIVVVEDWSGN